MNVTEAVLRRRSVRAFTEQPVAAELVREILDGPLARHAAQLVVEVTESLELQENSGAEANEAAIKMARKWGILNRHGAYEIIATHNGFHGRTLGSQQAGGIVQVRWCVIRVGGQTYFFNSRGQVHHAGRAEPQEENLVRGAPERGQKALVVRRIIP